MKPKVSVIVPVYNAELYLRRALDSIKYQTMSDFEVIMVDDGSSDSSLEICNEYCSRDSRFRVISKQNAGVSAARQDGLNAAIGEYIIHVDSDDWIESNMLAELYSKAKEYDTDVVICDYFINNGNSQVVIKQQPSSFEPKQIILDLFHKLHGSCWNKFVKRNCYRKYRIQFPKDINYCEDLITWVRLFSYDDVSVSYLNKAFYHYCDNPNSITRNYQRTQYEIRCRFVKELEKILPEEIKEEILLTVEFNIFVEANIYNVLSKSEINRGIRQYKSNIKKLGLRWRLGFFLLSYGFNTLAHKFLKY